MKTIKHQLKNDSNYIPTWDVKYLFLGTFNPEGGESVKYYYGRSKNRTWELLSDIFNINLNTNDKSFFENIKDKQIACLDIIDSVTIADNEFENVIGKGYSDSKIINSKVLRTYNTDKIISIIKNNPGIKVFSTWGKGSNLKEWKSELNKIEQIITLTSPSMAARVPKGVEKYKYMLENWKSKIK